MLKLICGQKTFLNFPSLVTSVLGVFVKNVDTVQIHLAHQLVLHHSSVVYHGRFLNGLVELAKENENESVFVGGTDPLCHVRRFVHE